MKKKKEVDRKKNATETRDEGLPDMRHQATVGPGSTGKEGEVRGQKISGRREKKYFDLLSSEYVHTVGRQVKD